MIRRIVLGGVALLACSAFAHAADQDDVMAAAKKLKDADNYSWKTTIDAGANAQFRPGPTEGRTDKGTTILMMSMRDMPVEAVIKGDKAAIKTEDGWQSLEEAGQDNGGQPGPGRFLARMLRNFKTPADQASENIDKLKELKKDGDAYTADLSEEIAKQMMRFGGGRRGGQGGQGGQGAQGGQGGGPQISNAKGNAKFWINDGVLTRYQVHITGTMNINGEDREIDRTTTTEIKDVGNTKVEVPEEAKKKLT